MIFVGINVEKALVDIGENCVQLRSLSVAYLGLSSWQPTSWPPLLEDLRYFTIYITQSTENTLGSRLGQVVKSADFINNHLTGKLLLCLVWVRATYKTYVRRAKFCLYICQGFFFLSFSNLHSTFGLFHFVFFNS